MEENKNNRLSVVSTLFLLVGLVVFMTGLISLSTAAGLKQNAFGYAFLLYWAAILRQDPKAYLRTILGGVVGILLAVLLDRSLSSNTTIAVVQYSVLAVVLFFYMRGQFNLVINNSCMLYMMISSIPVLDCVHNYRDMIGSLLLGALYMGAVSLAARPVKAKLAARAAARADRDVALRTNANPEASPSLR